MPTLRIPTCLPALPLTPLSPTGSPNAAEDAPDIARLANESGMKWIIIPSKHHKGFTMFNSQNPFTIVETTPFQRDPMQEPVAACRENGLGSGFYGSRSQDWTAPGGRHSPGANPDGTPARCEQYVGARHLPHVKRICAQHGPLDCVRSVTPGKRKPNHLSEIGCF